MRMFLLLPALLLMLSAAPALAHGPGGHEPLPPLPSEQAQVGGFSAGSAPLWPFFLAAPLAGAAVALLASRLMAASASSAAPSATSPEGDGEDELLGGSET